MARIGNWSSLRARAHGEEGPPPWVGENIAFVKPFFKYFPEFWATITKYAKFLRYESSIFEKNP